MFLFLTCSSCITDGGVSDGSTSDLQSVGVNIDRNSQCTFLFAVEMGEYKILVGHNGSQLFFLVKISTEENRVKTQSVIDNC